MKGSQFHNTLCTLASRDKLGKLRHQWNAMKRRSDTDRKTLTVNSTTKHTTAYIQNHALLTRFTPSQPAGLYQGNDGVDNDWDFEMEPK